MKKIWLALLFAASLVAHHSLGNYDTTRAVRVKGTVVEFQSINPHSFIFLAGKMRTDRLADGLSKARRCSNSFGPGSPRIF
jgi:hypothetical protein